MHGEAVPEQGKVPDEAPGHGQLVRALAHLDEEAPVHVEELGDTAERTHDVGPDVGGGKIDEAGGQVGDEALETDALVPMAWLWGGGGHAAGGVHGPHTVANRCAPVKGHSAATTCRRHAVRSGVAAA